jgi:hypothetical protein
MTIRSADEGVAVENSSHVFEVDLVIEQIAFALIRIPSEFANACEQPLYIFRHSKSSPNSEFDTVIPLKVRYDGFEAAILFPCPLTYLNALLQTGVQRTRPYTSTVPRFQTVYTYVLGRSMLLVLLTRPL